MSGIIIAVLTMLAVYLIFSALNDIITQQHLDMENTLHNSLRRAEQLAYIWFYEIKPAEFINAELLCFQTPAGEFWNHVRMICIPIIIPLTGKPVLGSDRITFKEEERNYTYKKMINPNYVKKYHTSDDLFFKLNTLWA